VELVTTCVTISTTPFSKAEIGIIMFDYSSRRRQVIETVFTEFCDVDVCQKNQPKQIVNVGSKTLAVFKFASTAVHESIHAARHLFFL
jgi:UDP-glucose 4-epimerase